MEAWCLRKNDAYNPKQSFWFTPCQELYCETGGCSMLRMSQDCSFSESGNRSWCQERRPRGYSIVVTLYDKLLNPQIWLFKFHSNFQWCLISDWNAVHVKPDCMFPCSYGFLLTSIFGWCQRRDNGSCGNLVLPATSVPLHQQRPQNKPPFSFLVFLQICLGCFDLQATQCLQVMDLNLKYLHFPLQLTKETPAWHRKIWCL